MKKNYESVYRMKLTGYQVRTAIGILNERRLALKSQGCTLENSEEYVGVFISSPPQPAQRKPFTTTPAPAAKKERKPLNQASSRLTLTRPHGYMTTQATGMHATSAEIRRTKRYTLTKTRITTAMSAARR